MALKYYQRLFLELQEMVRTQRPGETLKAPSLLSSIDIEGKRVAYAKMGLRQPSDPAILLIHGFGGFFMDWPRVMKPLSRRFRVYALDLPGWGFSEPWPENRAMADDVVVIKKFIKALGIQRVHIVGVSYGAGLAWAAAANHFPEIEKVLLLNPMPPYPLKYMKSPLYKAIFYANRSHVVSKWANKLLTRSAYKATAMETVRHQRLIESGYLDLGFLVMKQPKIATTIHYFAKAASKIDWAEWRKKIRTIKIPVTIMQSIDDKVFSAQGAYDLHELIPHAKLIEVKDSGHAIVFDQHRKVSSYIMHHW